MMDTQDTGAWLDVKAYRNEKPVSGLNIPPKVKAETRTRRVQAVFKPSTYDRLAKAAKHKGYSVNDFLNRIVEAYLSQAE